MERYVLTASNGLGLIPLWYYYRQHGFDLTTFLVSCIVLSSSMMHMSETKHGIEPGVTWRRWSMVLLNVDRGVAYVSVAYFGWMTLRNNDPVLAMTLVGVFLFGVIFMLLGESTTNVRIYTLLHLVWHIVMYSCLYGLFM